MPAHAHPGGRRRTSVLLVFTVVGSFPPPMLRRPGPLSTQAGAKKVTLKQMKRDGAFFPGAGKKGVPCREGALATSSWVRACREESGEG